MNAANATYRTARSAAYKQYKAEIAFYRGNFRNYAGRDGKVDAAELTKYLAHFRSTQEKKWVIW